MDLELSPDMRLSQEGRIATLTTPLGKDVLALVRFDGSEGLSESFEYRIEAISKVEDIDFDSAIGQACSVKFKTFGKERHFNGILVEAQWLGLKDVYYAYRLVLRPWVWLLSRTTDCRIFQDKTAVDIIKEVFSDRGFNDFRVGTTESYPKLEYCVQYRETDLAFVSRLMEQHGIYHFFEHSADKHTLVLADAKSSHKPVPGQAKMPFIPLGGADRRDREHLYHWSSERRFRTGKVQLNEYYELTPHADLKSDAKGSERYTKSSMEFYDYPGKYKKRSEGDKYAKVCLEAEQALDHRRHATGEAVSLFPGGLTTVEKHPRDLENKEYLIVRATHAFVSEFYRSGAGANPDEVYYGNYEFLQSDRVFRSAIVTPKPLIHGIQTAFVTGKAGEEIDVDEYGRIVVQFHWDRRGKNDEKSSCRIRTAECWAGNKWGGQFIPRIGMEVVVEFLEGDPDRPLVVGAVYNKDYKHPFDLPSNKTQSGLKSDSSKGGSGYNQIRFEDKKRSEEINMHAEKDHNVKVKHAETWEIGETFEVPLGMASREVTLKKGDDKLKIDTGNRDVDTAMMDTLKAGILIKLECGASKITMTPASISIEAPLIMLSGALIKIN